MRWFIIGGCGFVGGYLAASLRDRGEDVVVADLAGPVPGSADATPPGSYIRVDVRDPESVASLPLGPDDVVIHLAARQYHDRVPSRNRQAWFDEVNVAGLRNVLSHMQRRGCDRLVFFSTDMVYGVPQQIPVSVDHVQQPVGEYGRSKRAAEAACRAFRRVGGRATIMRPRLISGPGRLGIFRKLFWLIDRGLPVPMIGDGTNCYQMVSVHDCVSAIELAVEAGVPDAEFNLGSSNPPAIRDLLGRLIEDAGSRSRLIATPARLVKLVLGTLDRVGQPVMHREQYMIADCHYLVDTSETHRMLGWTPRHADQDMLVEAHRRYRALSACVPA